MRPARQNVAPESGLDLLSVPRQLCCHNKIRNGEALVSYAIATVKKFTCYLLQGKKRKARQRIFIGFLVHVIFQI